MWQERKDLHPHCTVLETGVLLKLRSYSREGVTRTHDLWLIRPLLQPTELLPHVVKVEGFEPPTSCSQGRRTTKLSYTLTRLTFLVSHQGSQKLEGLSPVNYAGWIILIAPALPVSVSLARLELALPP